ncbi:MAG: CHAD domain-containing protein [Phycisphaeraceae bacterium]
MAYEIRARETVEACVRRIAEELCDTALHQSRERPEGEQVAVHRSRRACKSMRAMLRLVRGALPEARQENNALRDAARGLSGSRDRLVIYETANALADKLPAAAQQRARSAVEALERQWREPETANESDAGRLDTFVTQMEPIADRASRWSLEAEGFEAVAGGLGRCYGRGREAMRQAMHTTEGEAYHDWRKRAKDLDHHLRLLTPVWPPVMRATRKQASRLGDVLGEHHDLIVLCHTLEPDPARFGGEKAVDALTRAAHRRLRQLEAKAAPLGRRLYAESRDRFVQRIGQYWQQWRLEDTPIAGSAAREQG